MKGANMKFRILFGAAMMVSSGAVATGMVGLTSIASAAPSGTAYTCTGGDIPSGTYASITVTGFWDVPADGTAVINVVGNLNVAAGAVFDAQSSPSTILVGHNVTAASGSHTRLGCQPKTRPPAHPPRD